MKRALLLAAALLIGIYFVLIHFARQGNKPDHIVLAKPPAIGQPAPGFRLKNLTGQLVALEDFKGKTVVLDFWTTSCAPCRAIMPELERLQQEHPNDVTLLAINLEQPEEVVIPFAQANKIQNSVLLDADGKIGLGYGVEAIPMLFIVDKKGILRYTQVGGSEGLRESLWTEIEKLKQ
jgi:thiol-disulfide isomerase/thioredoxin